MRDLKESTGSIASAGANLRLEHRDGLSFLRRAKGQANLIADLQIIRLIRYNVGQDGGPLPEGHIREHIWRC